MLLYLVAQMCQYIFNYHYIIFPGSTTKAMICSWWDRSPCSTATSQKILSFSFTPKIKLAEKHLNHMNIFFNDCLIIKNTVYHYPISGHTMF